MCRHPERPRPPAFIERLITGFVELHGDKLSMDDPEVIAGLGLLGDKRIAVAAYRRGAVGPGAGGLRKILRLLDLAERFGLPLVTFVDVTGVHPTDAPHGPMWPAVGQCFDRFMAARVATVAVITGEGVSGGALALCVTDRLIMLEHAYLSPAAPEAVAAIVWRDAARAPEVAAELRLTSADLAHVGLCTRVVPEGAGAHLHRDAVFTATLDALAMELDAALSIDAEARAERRLTRFRAAGLA